MWLFTIFGLIYTTLNIVKYRNLQDEYYNNNNNSTFVVPNYPGETGVNYYIAFILLNYVGSKIIVCLL